MHGWLCICMFVATTVIIRFIYTVISLFICFGDSLINKSFTILTCIIQLLLAGCNSCMLLTITVCSYKYIFGHAQYDQKSQPYKICKCISNYVTRFNCSIYRHTSVKSIHICEHFILVLTWISGRYPS